MNYRSIAIDGPSGAGKSTMAKRLAKEFNFLYVDTGAIYRTLGLSVYRRDIAPTDADAVTGVMSKIQIGMGYGEDGLQHMYLDGEDVTAAIRQHEISDYASKVSAIPAVRAFLLEMQRKFARENDVIMDGRDIGTVVLPDADLKIFLTADAEDRAMRRFLELQQRGQKTDYDTVLRDIKQRDKQDSERATAPLRQAEDAVLVDTTGMDLEGAYRKLKELVCRYFSIGGTEGE